MRRHFLAALLLSVLPGNALAQIEPTPRDPLIGTVWNFLGVNRQKINEFTFLKDGKVKCATEYKNATWSRIDKNNILFGYGVDSSYIVFKVTDGKANFMNGFHNSGRARYLQKVK